MNKNNKTVIFMILVLMLLISWMMISKSNYYIEKNIGIENRPFEEYVVFYPQHQDDEVLWGGSAIRTAINTLGSDRVFVVLVSDGTGVNVFKDKIYRNSTRKEKEELRDEEFYAALNDLGIKKENIIILSDIDNKTGDHFDLMRKVAIDFQNNYKNVTHVAHSYKYDDHPMHRKNGKVIYNLYKEGKIKDVMFFLKPKYVKNISIDKRIIYNADNLEDYNSIVKACNEYKLINEAKERRGIGYTSAHSYFDHLLQDPSLTSVLHLPLKIN
ncbi:MAG: PIG-L family deacetylase [Terrisporobacter sp.]